MDTFIKITVPGEKRMFQPKAISSDGEWVVGSSTEDYRSPQPIAWNGRTRRAIVLPTFGGPEGRAIAISGKGDLIVGLASRPEKHNVFLPPSTFEGQYIEEACIWKLFGRDRASDPILLSSLATDKPTQQTLAKAEIDPTGISADGKTIIGQLKLQTKDSWEQAGFALSVIRGLQLIKPLPKSNTCYPLSVSADGSVIVGYCCDAFIDVAQSIGLFIRENSTTRAWSPSAYPEAVLVSPDGKVIATATGVWNGGQCIARLPAVAMESPDCIAGISKEGEIVVGTYGPYLWTRRKNVRDLVPLLKSRPPLAESLKGWQIQRASALSSDGTTVVGTGTDPEGKESAWYLNIPKGLHTL